MCKSPIEPCFNSNHSQQVIAIRMFTLRENLLNREYVHYHNQIYWRLLRRYIEHKCQSIKQAQKKFHSVVSLMSEFDPLWERSRKPVVDELDVSQLSDLLMELLLVV